MFDRLVWQKDRVLLDELVFRLEHYRSDDWELGDECFVLYKTKPLMDQYAKFWSLRPGFRAEHILELGMWTGEHRLLVRAFSTLQTRGCGYSNAER